jgi:cell shape-determining protein MreD
MLKQMRSAQWPAMVLILIALLVGIIPFPFLGNLFIPWILTFIFLWQCDNDYHFNPIFIFVVALLFDFFTGGLLGLSPLLFLIFGRVVYNNRFILRGQTFYIKWMSFSVLSIILFVAEYVISSLAAMSLVSAVPYLISLILLLLTYPIFYKLSGMMEDYE